MADVFIYDVVRTPRGRGKAGKGGLSQLHPQELLAQTLNHLAARRGLDKQLIDDVSVGCVTQVKEQGACIARNALIAAHNLPLIILVFLVCGIWPQTAWLQALHWGGLQPGAPLPEPVPVLQRFELDSPL